MEKDNGFGYLVGELAGLRRDVTQIRRTQESMFEQLGELDKKMTAHLAEHRVRNGVLASDRKQLTEAFNFVRLAKFVGKVVLLVLATAGTVAGLVYTFLNILDKVR